MKGFLETISGLGVTAVLFIGASGVYGLFHGDSAEQLAPFWGWGIAILVVSLVAYGISKSITPSPSPNGTKSIGEDLAAKENNRKVAVELAGTGGMLGINARLWIKAHDSDPSVPIFGVRPYWTPTGPGGAPQLLSIMGLRGVDSRLDFVRQTDADDPLLPIMLNDPHPSVRDAVIARRR